VRVCDRSVPTTVENENGRVGDFYAFEDAGNFETKFVCCVFDDNALYENF